MNLLRKTMLALSAAIFACLAPAPVAAQDMPPLSAYGELPAIEQAVPSPSGKRIATLMTLDGVRALIVLEGTELLTATRVDDMKVRNVSWIGEERLLVTYGTTQDLGYGFVSDKFEFVVATIIPLDKATSGVTIFDDSRELVNAIFGYYGTRRIDGRYYGYFGAIELQRGQRSQYVFRHGRPFLYRVDLQNGKSEYVARAANREHDNDWLIDANGEVAVTYDIDETSGNWTIKNADRSTIAQGRTQSGRSGLIGLGRGGHSVIYYEAQSTDSSEYFEVPLAGGPVQPFLAGVDIERLYFDRLTGHLIGHLEEGGEARPVFEDAVKATAIEQIHNAFADYSMRIVAWSDDYNHVIVRTTGDQDSGSWFTVDVSNLRADAFAYERGSIGPRQVGPFSTFDYKASDGLEMDGILTLPPGRDAKDLPVVVLPHGGPHAHDSEGFDWLAQAFASRGYAVFQPNYRGSTNRDRAFRVAGYGQWGRKMQTDISDGLAALAEEGIVHSSRACIVGASYGGYAALAGVTLQQGLYRCAVAIAPVSDIGRMYREDYLTSGEARITRTALREQLGDPDLWDDVSPQRHADRADAPILLIHGRDDTVVPYIHSEKMADALDDEDKPYELVTLEGEDHWLSLSQTRQQMLAASMAFVQKHNPAD